MKKLLDSAKEKANEAREKATIKAQEALVEATIGVAKRKASSMVNDLMEGVVGAAEESLAGAQSAAGESSHPDLPIDDDDSDDSDVNDESTAEALALQAEQAEAERVAAAEARAAEAAANERLVAERAARAHEELARLKAEAAQRPPPPLVLAPEPEESDFEPEESDLEPEVPVEPAYILPSRRDPFEAAAAALRMAAEARGADPDEFEPVPHVLDDPMAAARAALDRAASARSRGGAPNSNTPSEVVSRAPRTVEQVLAAAAEARAMAGKGRLGQAREDAARVELARMKRDGFGPRAPSPSDEDDDLPADPGPRKRRL